MEHAALVEDHLEALDELIGVELDVVGEAAVVVEFRRPPAPFGRPRDPAVKQHKEFHELQDYVLACLRRAPGRGQVRVSV